MNPTEGDSPARSPGNIGDDPASGDVGRAQEWLERVLIACEESRAAGLTPPELGGILGDEGVGAGAADRLGNALATLELLRMRWADPPVPGMTVGRYEILRLLGSGGHGLVFLARDPSLKRRVALKVPRPEALGSDEMRKRFLREAHAIARLDHPGIVPIHDYGADGPVSYLATAFVDGPDLADWLDARGGPVGPEVAARLVLALAEAVAHAHARGVLHRDLKPANILMELGPEADGDPLPRITDFGLAKLLDEAGHTRTGALRLGTPGFAAPELSAAGVEAVGPEVDVYSLGAILHVLLAGRPPDGRGTPAMPRPLRTIVTRCLEPRPGDRYPTAAALADDLRRYLEGRPPRLRFPGRRLRRIGIRGGKALLAAGMLALSVWIRLAWRDNGPARSADAALAVRRAYLADIRNASQFLGSPVAERILDRWKDSGADDPRGFEWGYLRRLIHREVMSLRHDRGDVYCVRFSDDGRSLASAGLDGTARTWDAATGNPLAVLRHPAEVNAIDLSPDGTRAATAADDGAIRVWELPDGRPIGPPIVAHPGREAVCVKFVDGGRRLVSGGRDGRIVVVDVAEGAVIRDRAAGLGEIEALEVPRDGSRIYAAGSSGGVVVGVFRPDLSPSRPLTADWAPRLTKILNVAVTPDDRLAAATVDGGVAIWGPSRDDPPRSLPSHSGRPCGLAFAPDGRWLAMTGDAGDPVVRVWDVDSGRLQDNFLGHADRVWCVAFAPDGRRLASASRDGTIKVWVLDHSRQRQGFHPAGPAVVAIGFASGGRELLIDHGGEVSVYDLDRATGAAEVLRVSRPDGDGCVSEDGRMVARARRPDSVAIHELRGGRGPLEIRTDVQGGSRSLAFSPDGRLLAVLGASGRSLRLFHTPAGDLDRAKLRDREGRSVPAAILSFDREGPDIPLGFTFTPDGRSIAFWTGATPAVWEILAGRLRKGSVAAPGPITAIAVLPDGRHFATADRGHAIQVRDAASLAVIGGWSLPPSADVKVLAYSPDGKALATGEAGDSGGVVRLFDAGTGTELLVWGEHGKPVDLLRFSPDGAHLAAASMAESRIVVWNSERPGR